MNPVVVGALGELIATAVATTAGKSWKTIKSSPEAKTVKAAVDRALVGAFRDARRGQVMADDDWVAAVAEVWERAFTVEVSHSLIVSLASANESQYDFIVVAVKALRESGCDIEELERTFWVEQFLCVLPRLLFEQLRMAALGSDGTVRDLVGHLLEQRIEARAANADAVLATPREFREDVIALLHRLDEEARTGRLPPYLPRGADVSILARTVRVRPGVRTKLSLDESARAIVGRAYRLPVELTEDIDPPRPWPEIAVANRRLVVLADPGLGKSWLIRTETHRLLLTA